MKTQRYVLDTFGVIFSLCLVAPATGFAQESTSSSPYSTNGHCSMQGSWTRAALAQTNEIKQVITKMKDNPACNGLKTSMEANLTAMEGSLKEIEGLQTNNGNTRTLSQLPEDITALRTFSRQTSPFKTNIMDLLVGKTIQMSALSSAPANGANNASVAAMASRTRAAALTGLQLFNNTMSSFQEANQGCLEAGPTSAVIASGMVKILNSFAGSNAGIGNQIALSVQKVSQYLARDKKYVDALRKLNDTDFITSMSCLMEITTESYCDALDAQYLFKELTDSQSIKIQNVTNPRTGKVVQKIVGLNQSVDKRMAKGALSGYYILTRQLPLVTEWLQKVQMGITPQLPSQADFKVLVSNNVQEHKNRITRIEGRFNYGRNTLKKMTDISTKQGQALQILFDVGGNMVGDKASPLENFFMKASTEPEIYFGLLGMPVPTEVSSSNSQSFGNAVGWLQANFRSLPAFSDPDKLTDVIEKNMRAIFEISTKQSLIFYNQNFVIDKAQVVGDSLLGLDSNVRDALVNIDNYLAGVELKFQQEKDSSYLPLITSTRGKIGRILTKYRSLHNYSVQVLNLRKTDPDFAQMSHEEIDEKLRKVANDLLDEVYTQLEIQTALTGLLANRLSGIVLEDYTLSMKKRADFGGQYEDIMLASGYLAMNTMLNMGQSDLTKVKIDLAQALNINKTNIDSLENIVTGVYVRNIFNNKIRMTNENITETQRNLLAYQWAYKMAEVQFPGESANFLQRKARAHLARFWGDISGRDSEYFGVTALDKALHPFKQIFNGLTGRKGNIFASATSEFETNKTMLGVYCAQTLAFANFTPFWALCYDTELESPLKNNKVIRDPEVLKLMDSYLAIQYKDKAFEYIATSKSHPMINGLDRARNIQSRICAVRDYHRRNKIAEATSAMREDDEENESAFLNSLAKDLKKNIR